MLRPPSGVFRSPLPRLASGCRSALTSRGLKVVHRCVACTAHTRIAEVLPPVSPPFALRSPFFVALPWQSSLPGPVVLLSFLPFVLSFWIKIRKNIHGSCVFTRFLVRPQRSFDTVTAEIFLSESVRCINRILLSSVYLAKGDIFIRGKRCIYSRDGF